MSTEEARGYCEECGRSVLARRPAFNHVLHLLVTALMCGLWLPAWAFLFLTHNPDWLCPRCGSEVDLPRGGHPVLAVALVIGAGLAILSPCLIGVLVYGSMRR